MPRYATLAVLASTLFAAALMVAVPARRGVAQPQASVPNIGRYQIMQAGEARSCFVIDTTSGHTWQWIGHGWVDAGSPLVPRK